MKKFDRSAIASLLDKHGGLCRAVYESNAMFKFYVSSSYMLLAPSLVLTLYVLIALKPSGTVDLFILGSWAALSTLIILALTLPAAEIHSEVTNFVVTSLFDRKFILED